MVGFGFSFFVCYFCEGSLTGIAFLLRLSVLTERLPSATGRFLSISFCL